MSLIVRREGVALEEQIGDFAHELHGMMQGVVSESTAGPDVRPFNTNAPWRSQDIALTPIVWEELNDTFPDESFCMMRGQRHAPNREPALEDARSWVSWVSPNLAASYVIDLAATTYLIAPYVELRQAGLTYSGFAGFRTIAAYQQHLQKYDPTAPIRIGRMRDLFELAIVESSSSADILETKEAS